MLTLLGAALTGMGLLAYTGLWRSWSRGGHHFYVLGLFWYGLAMLGTSTLYAFRPVPEWTRYLVIGVMLVGVIGAFYLPPFMTPRWFRAMRRAHR
ncbi:hypothetical protein [Clavibacter sp. CFBP 8614]|uniref:hypothetical protein n=1 Tax=unclassified Clavibacter TaxID=2626594 RepID=UPI004041730F